MAGEFLELLRGSGQWGKCAEVHGNYFLDPQKLAGISGFPRTHGKEVSNGQHRQIRLVKLPNEFHVAEKIGIAGVVNLKLVGELNHVPDGLTSVDNLPVVQNAATMVGMDHSQSEILDLLTPPLVHGACLCGRFAFHPMAKLKNSYHIGGMAPRQLNGISDMIKVAMSQKKNVQALKLLQRLRSGRITHHPGINDHNILVGCNQLER